MAVFWFLADYYWVLASTTTAQRHPRAELQAATVPLPIDTCLKGFLSWPATGRNTLSTENNSPTQLMHNGTIMKRVTGRNHRATTIWSKTSMSIPLGFYNRKSPEKNNVSSSGYLTGLLGNYRPNEITKSSNRNVYSYNPNNIRTLSGATNICL